MTSTDIFVEVFSLGFGHSKLSKLIPRGVYVDFKFFVGYGKVKVPKVILKNYTNFVVTDGTGSGWPLDKMEIKKWKQISTSTFAV